MKKEIENLNRILSLGYNNKLIDILAEIRLTEEENYKILLETHRNKIVLENLTKEQAKEIAKQLTQEIDKRIKDTEETKRIIEFYKE